MTPLILVVDDDPDTRELYRVVYESGDYRVVEARSVAEALAFANSLRPDVVLTDWLLGDGDGFALCMGLREGGDTRHIPVIAATGVTLSPDEIARANQLGCHAVLMKPVALDAMVRLTAAALGTSQRPS